MLSSGVPLVLALESLSRQPEHEQFGLIVHSICRKVSHGNPFSDSLRFYPRLFPRVYVTMVKAGEETGRLENCLVRLAEWLERDESIRRKIRSSLTYPAFVLGLCAILSLIIIYTVLPTFVTIFREMNTPLPLITRLMIMLTEGLRSPSFWLFLGLVGFGSVYQIRKFVSHPRGAALVYRMAQGLPLVGTLLRHGTAARYCAAASPLLASGMSLPRALRLAAGSSGNPLVDQDAAALVKAVEDGLNPSQHMAFFPNIYSRSLVHMLSVGEEAARAADMFDSAGRFHQLEMETAVELLGAALEPILLLGVSVIVGLLLLAIFLPLYASLSSIA